MMVAQRHNIAATIDTLERAVLMQRLLEVINAVSTASDQIAAADYWEGHQTISHAECVLAEIAERLHELDLKQTGGAK